MEDTRNYEIDLDQRVEVQAHPYIDGMTGLLMSLLTSRIKESINPFRL